MSFTDPENRKMFLRAPIMFINSNSRRISTANKETCKSVRKFPDNPPTCSGPANERSSSHEHDSLCDALKNEDDATCKEVANVDQVLEILRKDDRIQGLIDIHHLWRINLDFIADRLAFLI